MYEIIQGDIFDIDLPKNKFRTCITSPPYFALRTYGEDDREIGQEPLDEYIQKIVESMRVVRDSLTEDGTLWLNIGDCYNGSGGAGSDYKEGGIKASKNKWGSRNVEGLPPKNLLGVGWRVALALQRDGWVLRSEVIWRKTRAYPQPEGYIKRPVPNHEQIFFFSKSQDYFYQPQNLFTVWDMTPESSYGHEAPFPIALPMTCLLASTEEDDWVLDCFAGSGTTAVACELANRNSVMVDLYRECCDTMEERLSSLAKKEEIEWL